MPWCGRCGTGLSQMEVAEGRRITTHTSVFVRFPIKGQEKDRAAGLDHDSLDADVERRGRGESGDDLPEGPARRLDLLRRQGELRARPRAGSASGRQARDAQAAIDPHHSEGQRRRGSAGRIARTRSAGPHLHRARSTICRRRTRPAAFFRTARRAADDGGGIASRDRLERSERGGRHGAGPHRARLRRRGSGTRARRTIFRSSRRWTRARFFRTGSDRSPDAMPTKWPTKWWRR